MRKYIILFFSVFPFLFACNSGGSSGDVMPEDQMIAVLTAVHLADGRLINISQAPDTLYKYGTSRYLAVFKKFHTDSAQFRRSYQYYSTEPEKFADMYDKVLKILQAKTDSLNKLLTKENQARVKQQQAKPVVTDPNGRYGVGLQPQVPLPTHAVSPSGPPAPANITARMRVIRDSIKRAHLLKRNALPAK
jgi:Domain of unknown function (DUF4296)